MNLIDQCNNQQNISGLYRLSDDKTFVKVDLYLKIRVCGRNTIIYGIVLNGLTFSYLQKNFTRCVLYVYVFVCHIILVVDLIFFEKM